MICFQIDRDVAQPGSAPDWGSGGRGFESRHPDQLSLTLANSRVSYGWQATRRWTAEGSPIVVIEFAS